ncbi:MAG: hypothetical protein Q9162_005436 [Coniocarpon cinnabarinum]
MAPVQIVPINGHTDGDPSHRPNDELWTIIDPPTIYLEKIAVQWLQVRGQHVQKGTIYRLDRLPDGYALYEKQRKTGIPGQKLARSDKRLFGSAMHKFFDSPNRFFPHFQHMMEGKDMNSCPCTVCGSAGSQALPMRGTGTAHPGPSNPGPSKPGRKPGFKPGPKPSKPVEPPAPVYQDEEHVPDVLRILIDRLKRQGQLETDFKEELSMDWRSERSLPRLLDALPKHASFVPRVGEIVLFVRFLDDNHEICQERESGYYKIFDKISQTFLGPPKWEAGVVAQNASVQLEDIVTQSSRTKNSTLAGFRIEPLPKPSDMDKRASKQYKYVPLQWIRPFVFWQEFLAGIPELKWHPTICNAQTTMSSFSLMEKYAFSGHWPKANINCKGVYVGSELWVTGDGVRILPDALEQPDAGPPHVTDVLHITSVVLQLTNLDKSTDNDEDDRHPYNSAVWLYGKLYTISPDRAWNDIPEPLTKQEEYALPQGLQGYRLWHRHDPRKSARVPLKKVLGRCFEADSMNLWFPSSTGEPSTAKALDLGLMGLYHARDYAKEHDARILSDKELYWADSRGEALDIAELNGVKLSQHDPERDEEKLEDWATASRILANRTSKLEKFKYTEHPIRAPTTGSDNAAMTIEETAQEEEVTSKKSDSERRFRQPSATPSDELDMSGEALRAQWGIGNTKLSSKQATESPAPVYEEDERAISARFGLGGNRKRSHSVADMDGAADSSDGAEIRYQKHKQDEESEDEDESGEGQESEEQEVKGVARSRGGLWEKMAGSMKAALVKRERDESVKRARMDSEE